MCASAIALGACSYSANKLPPVSAAPDASSGTAGQGAGQRAAHRARAQRGGLKSIADELAASGQHEAAIPLYRQLSAGSGDRDALVGLASSLSAHGAHQDAAKVLALLVARGQMTGGSWYTLGKINLALGRFDEALSAFSAASMAGEATAKVRSGTGIALAAMGRTREAMSALNGAVDPVGLSNRALLLATTGKPGAAINILEPLVQAGLLGPQGRQNLAMAYLLGGREADAFRLARVDLDGATIGDTFTFYRSLASLDAPERMQALVTGTIDPSWTRRDAGNLQLADTQAQSQAAMRIVEKPVMMAAAPRPKPTVIPKPVPAPMPKPKPERVAKPEPAAKPAALAALADYELTEVPPLLEPEGWALQIGAYRTTKNLMRGWTILYRKSGDLLQDVPPRRSEVDFGNRKKSPRGFFYRLNAGPLKTFGEAKSLCRALKSRGTSCWIRPPEETEGSLPANQRAKDKDQARQVASTSTPK